MTEDIQVAQPTEASATTPDSKPEVSKGMLSSVKNLYQGKKDDDGKRDWVEEMPDLNPPVENASTAQHALLVRKVKSYDGRKMFNIDSIVIQSPLLRKALGTVLDGYPGVATDLDKLTFEPGFGPFVHRWSKLRDVLHEMSESPQKEHLQLFHDVLEEELRDAIATRDDFLKHGYIDFDSLWMLFEPGNLIYSSRYGQPCVAKLKAGWYDEDRCGKYFALGCRNVDWDGETFGYASTTFQVRQFPGTVRISSLNSMPLQYCGNMETVKQNIIARGKAWEALAGYHYMFYQGYAVELTANGPQAVSVDSRIVIDTYGWNKFEPNSAVQVSKFDTSEADSDIDVDEDDIYSDDGSYPMPCADDLNVDTIDKQSPKSITPLTDDQRLLTVATLRGYSLKDKKWLILFLDKIRSNTFSSEAFSSLVLEDQQKDLVLALTTAQRKHKNVFDDIVAGKGRGMIMLLAGPPGVGKTLTAESVAEVLEVPLYVVGAGDLGDQGRNVERNLQKILEMCARWKAVCLIDEADVFLEARNANDLERNKLVSIFLRTLEYYEGILFLTTNRVDNIDAAFQSRIHLSLAYPDLTPASRRQVWSNFINKAAKTSHASEFKDTGDKSTATAIARPDFSDEDLDRLCNFKMNGREIKNVLKTAQLLATMKEEGLTVKHIETVMKVEQRYQGKL